MTDEAVKDGSLDTPEKVAPPAQGPTFSETSDAKRSDGNLASSGDLTEEKLVKLLEERDEKLRRTLQSMTDKRFDKLERGTSVLGEYKQLIKEGYTEKEADQELRLRLIEQGASAVQSVQGRTDETGTKTETPAFNYQQVLSDAGLDANQPEVISLIRGQYRNPDHFQAEAFKLAKRLSSKPAPSASAAPAMQGGEVPDKDAAALLRDYQTKMIAARGNRTLLKQIKEEYTKKGVPVDTVVFT